MGWQTFAKVVEHEVNSIPLGFLEHKEDVAPLLRILTQNFLKLNAANNRSPKDLFSLPHGGSDLTSRLEEAHRLFFRMWNEDYVPLIAQRQKWHHETEDLAPRDIVYFKLRDSPISSKWLIGKVEDIVRSKDGKVRRVIIGYKYDTEQGERTFRVVERPVRECVKLLNIEDTTLFEDIEAVREASKDILGLHVNWHSRHDMNHSLTTFACNAICGETFYESCSTDIGYEILSLANSASSGDVDYDCDEKKLDTKDDGDIYFDTMINDENDDKFNDYDYDICLL